MQNKYPRFKDLIFHSLSVSDKFHDRLQNHIKSNYDFNNGYYIKVYRDPKIRYTVLCYKDGKNVSITEILRNEYIILDSIGSIGSRYSDHTNYNYPILKNVDTNIINFCMEMLSIQKRTALHLTKKIDFVLE